MSDENTMTATERRASFGLASIFALRMIGLFWVMPVFALEAQFYPGGDNPALVGAALGAYGLTQALLQIPYGMASDRFGRKRIICLGLIIFVLGSFVAAMAQDVSGLLIGRTIQGAGAISAAVTALLADQTRDSVRTKSMAVVGIGIGVSFAFSLISAPLLAAKWGLSGIFVLTAVLAVVGAVVLFGIVPPEPAKTTTTVAKGGFLQILNSHELGSLNLGVMILHAVQVSMWLAVPNLLVQAGLPKMAHWQAYLPAYGVSFLLMGAGLFRLERAGYLRAVFLCSIALVMVAELGFFLQLFFSSKAAPLNLNLLIFLLAVFFMGFNVLEATQPSLVSKTASPSQRGAALGLYNTSQSLGLFAGGALGGWIIRYWSPGYLFAFSVCACIIWLILAWPMPAIVSKQST